MEKEPIQILETNDKKEIKDLIYTFRDRQVMLDSDIASLFNVETKKMNQQVKRNPNRFPGDFCFKLNSKELKDYRSQNVTFRNLTSQNAISSYGGRRYLPYV